ncbi:SDR family oxidoreductase [Pedobacter miscanthi]|uniref:SDR family oxidoreductase n=1 Tax=Pedobacter miscanthi TaxID=2259170 RepID=UPI00292F19E0|nr:SDR family oxidoreductase [Pedobacter miscanthi]
MKNLEEKVALVTGASRGIGAAIAQKLAAEGAKVIVNYAGSQNEAEAVVKAIESNGGSAIAIRADISIAQDVEHLFDASISHFGRIHILVNNAGIMITKPIKDTTDEDFDRQFNINVKGTFLTLREAATKLAENGAIINFSTSVNRVIVPTYGTYVATKSAVEQLTRVFAKEIGARGITVNSVSPGPVNTELFIKGKPQQAIDGAKASSPFNRLGEPEDIANVVAFLAGSEAKWISGQNIGVNGAMS